MALVKVWNENSHPYKERFKELNVNIPAKRFIVMDEDDAQQFKSGYAPILTDGDGRHLPEGFKMIRLEKMPAEEQMKYGATQEEVANRKAIVDENLCIVCNFAAQSKEELDDHMTALHMDSMLTLEKEEDLKQKQASKKRDYPEVKA